MTLFDGLAGVFTNTFGEVVTILPLGGSLADITAILKLPTEIDTLDGEAVTTETYLRARTADVECLKYDDTIWARGIEYRAGTPRRDTRGMTHIPLRLP